MIFDWHSHERIAMSDTDDRLSDAKIFAFLLSARLILKQSRQGDDHEKN